MAIRPAETSMAGYAGNSRCYQSETMRKAKYTIFKFLRTFDIAENMSWNVVMYSQGWWTMSFKKAVSQGMGIKWFARFGLQSISNRIIGTG
jgi:hypothetical protein